MQQRDIIKDQIELAGRVIGKAIARYFDLKSRGDINLAVSETQSRLQSELDLDLEQLLKFRSAEELQQYLNKRYLAPDHLDLLCQFLYEAGKSQLDQSPLNAYRYLSTCVKIIDVTGDMTDIISMERILLRTKVNEIIPRRLIVLSDMYGYSGQDTPDYMQYDMDGYICQYYDVSRLAEIDQDQNDIHAQYIENGIRKAVNALLELEPHTVDVIAYSIGGTIAWQAALNGLKINHLIAVSSTRLRLENTKPECKITLMYGDTDAYQPSKEWYEQIGIEPIMIEGAGHEIYKSVETKQRVTALLSDSF